MKVTRRSALKLWGAELLTLLLPRTLFLQGEVQDVAPVQGGGLGYGMVDVTQSAGLNFLHVCGGDTRKKYILETTGSGVAFIDYDNDGWLDIFLVNGSRLEGFPAGQEPSNHLFHNNRDGTFTNVTRKTGVGGVPQRWSTGCAFVDYDRDGHLDLFVTHYVSFDL